MAGKERKPAAELGISYNWTILTGALQLPAIYFIYVNDYLPVLILAGIPYLLFAVRMTTRKKYMWAVVVVLITALIAIRWMSIEGML